MSRPRIAILDDYQRVALGLAEWSALDAEIEVFHEAFRDEDDAAARLAAFDIVSLLRERTAFPASLIRRLPRLKLVSMTGSRTSTLDIAACTAAGIAVTFTANTPSQATAELAIGLAIACARAIPAAERNMREGRWQDGVPLGISLAGRRLGVVGLGKLGTRMALIGQAIGMEVVAWSANLTPERAAESGVTAVAKDALFATADVVSVHLALSDRTRGVVGAAELEAMKPGSIFINTARAALVDQQALLDVLRRGRIFAGLDVFDVEPLPPDHPLRGLPNVVLTPHLGYVVTDAVTDFYRASVANIAAFLAGTPVNLANPDVLARRRPG